AKCTAVLWRGIKINIVDTPGHADFGGEVERILSMVDGALLLVDAAEGPMPQTKFVLAKALERGLAPIVVINKVDRRDARPHAVVDAVFDLFAALGANEDQLDFPTLYASAREGWAADELEAPRVGMEPLFHAIAANVEPPRSDSDGPFAMLASILEYDAHLGRVLTGRIARGAAEVNMPVTALDRDGNPVEHARMTKLLTFNGLAREPARRVPAGDIVAIAGLKTATVADTVAAAEAPEALPAAPVDPPTLAMRFTINDSPLAGREGDKVTSRMLRDRLFREAESNVAIDLRTIPGEDGIEVRGRGELQLGVLIETLRREGYELSVSRPRVLYRTDPETGTRLEPLEEVIVDVDDAHVGTVVESLGRRSGEMSDMRPSGGGKTRVSFIAPSRGLIGFLGVLMNDTRGTGAMSRVFHGYGPHRGALEDRPRGVLISTGDGEAVEYALHNLEERGTLFVEPGERVYGGMIVGEHSRGQDLEVNPLKTKQLTNIRAAGKDEGIRLTPPRRLRLEEAISYIADDELVEVTPGSIRLRKALLDPHARRRAQRRAAG
ncbi:MAG: translational GTPase TypA, partial [Defluviicoccus sp.]|nr:translational GTPase TypA [Defluviicoccus sp.]